MTVLTVTKLEAATANCGFKLEADKLGLLLESAGLTRETARSRLRSPSLQQQIDAVATAYRTDAATACTQAWDTFGPDGMARGYLSQ